MQGMDEANELKSILSSFFAKRAVRKKLQLISDHHIYGCEKWLQIELIAFLHNVKNVIKSDILKEERLAYDGRKNSNNKHQRVDITFRIKNKHYYNAIEIKHKPHLALQDIKRDLNKLALLRPLDKGYFRKAFSLLIHPFQKEDSIKYKIKNKGLSYKLEFSLKIGKTGMSCSLFSAPV